MHAAFQAWDRASEPLETTELRIHDGAPLEGLPKRAQWYIGTLQQLFPWATPTPGATVMEIGSGLGYVMEAALARYQPRRVIGLDVAPSMLEKARARLQRDGVTDPRLEFLLYDGITVPLADNSVDYVYSVAALQHVPKTYVYNLFLEIKRILSPSGFCGIHLLSCNNIGEHSRLVPFAQEIGNQLRGEDTHWHHFYAFDELLRVLADGVEAKQIDIVDGDVSIWASFAKTGPTFHRPDLPTEAHIPRAHERHEAAAGARSLRGRRLVRLPLVTWQRLSLGRIMRAAKRMVRGAVRTVRPYPGPVSEAKASVGDGERAAGPGLWPQDRALLPWYDQDNWADAIPGLCGKRDRADSDSAMLRQWCEGGYVVLPGLVDVKLIDAFVREIDDVWERTDPIDGLAVSDVNLDEGYRVHVPHGDLVRLDLEQRRRIRDASNWRIGQYHLYSRAARQIFDHPDISRIASTIFARRGVPRYSLMFSKGTEQGLHQDTCVFHIFPRDLMLGVWIACEDISPESGPLEYYPGSQRTPLFMEFTNYPQTNRRTSDPEQSKRYDAYIIELAKKFQKHELLIRKGDVMFWHPMLIHGGSPRRNRLATRKSFVLHVIAEGCDVGGRVQGPFNW
ncbi:MAG TPA: phytanoyl-CoA dioxygenase family protein [Casimicrobiaceae bacterium]|jgi:ectoine hydroxylase-related dioxygenase (phytanoyl-CoA dioxygenase family)/ubiquinone/menaquinone biosynthesis C-methylase UbiE|nr:phytanoyl-CoA dioxygenase family protein [Casimicrobiaceae bacterium]